MPQQILQVDQAKVRNFSGTTGDLFVNGLHWSTVRQEQWRVCGQNYAITPFKGVFTGAAAWKCFWSVIPISLPNSGFSMPFPETMW